MKNVWKFCIIIKSFYSDGTITDYRIIQKWQAAMTNADWHLNSSLNRFMVTSTNNNAYN